MNIERELFNRVMLAVFGWSDPLWECNRDVVNILGGLAGGKKHKQMFHLCLEEKNLFPSKKKGEYFKGFLVEVKWLCLQEIKFVA